MHPKPFREPDSRVRVALLRLSRPARGAIVRENEIPQGPGDEARSGLQKDDDEL